MKKVIISLFVLGLMVTVGASKASAATSISPLNVATIAQKINDCSVVVDGIRYTLDPCSINETITEGDADKHFKITVKQSKVTTYGFTVYGYGEGLPTYGILTDVSSGGNVGNLVMNAYFSNNVFKANGQSPKVYTGYLPIKIISFNGEKVSKFLKLQTTLTVKPKPDLTKADLVVTDLKIDKLAPWDSEATKYIWVSFKNLGGNGGSGKTVDVKVTDLTNNQVYYMTVNNVNLTSGYTNTLSVNMPVKNLYSTHNFKAEINPDKLISESNTSNNVFEKSITIFGKN
jgi:hypothetical protein